MLQGQEGGFELAKQHSKFYSLEAEFGLDEYRMVAKIAAESSTEAELLFSSKATMEILRATDIRYERFDCSPKIHSDDRQNANNGKGGVVDYGPFARRENWERIEVDGRWLDLRESSGVGKKTPIFSQPVHEYYLRNSTACLGPFDWPIQGPSYFNGNRKEKDNHKLVFGADRKCVCKTVKVQVFQPLENDNTALSSQNGNFVIDLMKGTTDNQ
jgi:hypothetical protein